MASKFTLDQFRSRVVNDGLAMGNQFMVHIHPYIKSLSQQEGELKGDIKVGAASSIGRLIPFFAHAAETPGYNVQTTQHRRFSVGPMYTYPLANVNGEVTIVFYVDHQGKILDYFHRWMNSVFDFQIVDRSSVAAANPYTVGYKNEYATEIEVSLFQRGINCFQQYVLRHAWPVAVGSMQVDWANHDILRLSVRFAYDSFSLVKIDNGAPTLKNIIGNPKEVLSSVISSAGYGELVGAGIEAFDIYKRVNSTANLIKSIGF